MKKCDIWAVVAVYLMQKTDAHYRDITNYVLSTNLTSLRDSNDRDATIRSILSTTSIINGLNLFRSYTKEYPNSKGVWTLNEDEEVVKELEQVQYVYKRLGEKKNEPDIEKIKEENKKLHEENKQLIEKLQSIKKLCEEV